MQVWAGSGAPTARSVVSYELVVPGSSSSASSILFKIPYSLGTHDGVVKAASGTLQLEGKSFLTARGEFRVPIASIETGDRNRDCHLLEAMGLDYVASGYPEEHVCDSEDRLPAEGPNRVTHSEIQFRLKSVRAVEGSVDRIEAEGDWTMHGVTRTVKIPFQVTALEEGGFRVRGEHRFSISEYGIEVKPAKILLLKITVDDVATVTFDLRLRPIAPKG
jgi:polyisoprenoid-binding protein YceI